MNAQEIVTLFAVAAPVAAVVLGIHWERKATRLLRERRAAKVAKRAAITGANWEKSFSNRATG